MRTGRHASAEAGPGGPASLLHRASGALLWSFANTVASRLGTLGIGIVLARVLGPKEFGTYAVAYVALVAVLSFNELGVSLAIVRWPGDPRAILPTVSTISVLFSALVTAVCWFSAPAFSAALGDPAATPVVRALAMTVLIAGLVATPAALLERQFSQGKRAVVDQVNTWVGAITSITLALLGMGAMSLAVGRLAGSLGSAALFLRYSPERLRFGLDRCQLRSLLAFGLPLAGASLVVFAVGYVDQLVAGRVLGPIALGFYVLAFNLSNWPAGIFSLPLRSVAPPTFARMQHRPDAMASTFLAILGLLSRFTLPICLTIAACARPLVAFVYGPEWTPAASALAWLAGLAAFKIVFELAYDYLVVLGVSGSILLLQVITLVTLVPALIVGAHLAALAGLAGAQVAVAAAVVLPLYLFRFSRVGLAATVLCRRLLWPALVTAALSGVVVGLQHTDLSAISILVISAGLGCAAVGLLVVADRDQIRALRTALAAEPAEQSTFSDLQVAL